MPSLSDKYIDFINKNILPHIDYKALQKSYQTQDKAYAKGVLNLLHQAMVNCYGSEVLHPNYIGDMEENFVVIPGIVQGRKFRQFCLALLELDLSSSGEHWGTDFLTQYGVIPQRNAENIPHELTKLMTHRFIPYDYAYTATIPDDIHIKHGLLPTELKEILQTFQNYTAELLPQVEHQPDAYPESEDFPNAEDEDEMEL